MLLSAIVGSVIRVCGIVIPLFAEVVSMAAQPAMHTLDPTWEVMYRSPTALAVVRPGQVAIGNDRGELRFLDCQNGMTEESVGSAHVHYIKCLKALKNGDVLYSLDEAGELVVWDPMNHRVTRRFEVGEASAEMAFSGDGNTLAIRYTTLSGPVNRFRTFDGKIIDSTPFARYAEPGPKEFLTLQAIGLNQDGGQACVVMNRKIAMFDFAKSQVVGHDQVADGTVSTAAFEPGMSIAVFVIPKRVEVWKDGRSTRLAEATIPSHGAFKGVGVDSVAISAEHKAVAIALGGVIGRPSYMWLWRWGNPDSSVVFQVSKSSLVHGCVFSTDAKSLFTISDDNKIRRFDIDKLLPEKGRQ